MLGADLLRASALAAMAACVVTDAPAAIVYVLASVVAVLATVFEPAQSALIPSLARTPEELTAANVELEHASKASASASAPRSAGSCWPSRTSGSSSS